MLCKDQKFKISWNKSNKKWYQSKGYEYTKIGDEFIVDIKDLMKGSKIRVKCICDYCGKEYDCFYYAYNKSRERIPKDACNMCSGQKNKETTLNKRIKKNYARAQKRCLEEGYELISDYSDFDDIKNKKIKVKCLIHGIFEINASNFIYGHGCYFCGRMNAKNKLKTCPNDIEKYINKFNNNILLNKHEYANAYTPNLQIKCGSCERVFVTSLSSYKKTSHRCSNCGCISKGELSIKNILENNSIDFIQQKRFDGCKDIKSLPFDFFLPDYNLCIEFQGKQHFYPINYFGGEYYFNILREHDKIKKEYCDENNLMLIEIKYDEIDKIYDILDEIINFA